MIHGHGGNIYQLADRLGCRPEQIVDVSSNINPMGPPPGMVQFLRENMTAVCSLPEVDSRGTETKMARMLGIDRDTLLAGAGTTQFIYAMYPVLGSEKVLIAGPTYADYADACRMHGLQAAFLTATAGNDFHPDMQRLDRMAGGFDTVVICNPNNPTGAMIQRRALDDLCRRNAHTRFVIDESYLGFHPSAEAESMVSCDLENVIVLHSLSKLYRLPGLRIGFLKAAEEIVDRFRAGRTPWSLNSLAQMAVRFLADHTDAMAQFAAESRAFIIGERKRLLERLNAHGRLRAYPSQTTFFLVELPGKLRAPLVWERFAQEGMLIRDCSNFAGLGDRFIRIAVNRPEINQQIAEMLLDVCHAEDD
jgi:threonine-phosphate decarboxylase